MGCAAALSTSVLAIAAPISRATAGPVQVTVNPTPLSAGLPTGFLGLALETRTIPQWVGNATSASAVDPVLLGLIRSLDPTGRPVIRIGGESTDRSWWPVPKMRAPSGITYTLTPAWAQDARSLAQALDAHLIVGINLEANSLSLSSYEAKQLVSRIGTQYLDDLEIGNEAALYTSVPWYMSLHGERLPWYMRHTGTPVLSRPLSYNETDFIAEFERTLAVLPKNVAIAGPDALSTAWLPRFSKLLSSRGRIRILDSHEYPLAACSSDPLSPHYPSIGHLLSTGAWRNVLNGALSSVALAHHDGLQFRIDEMGSVTCGGHPGVSNTMASALWVTDALFEAAREGVDGVNLHTYPGVSNDLFDITDTAHGWSAVVRPIYDGAAMFARADPVGARELQLSSNGPSAIQTWATMGADHQVRVLIDNSGAGRRLVSIHAPSGFGSQDGSVERLLAPSVTSTTGLTIGGEPFDTTTTGALPAPALQIARPKPGGYLIAAPADSETLLTLRS